MNAPKKLAEAVHINDFVSFKDEVTQKLSDGRVRMKAIEDNHECLETTMKYRIDPIHAAIMGDINQPEKKGMAEDLRSLKSDMRSLIKLHDDEVKAALKERNSIKERSATMFEQLSWKTIAAMVSVIGALVAVIYKLIDLIR